jgi:hypothetical protein
LLTGGNVQFLTPIWIHMSWWWVSSSSQYANHWFSLEYACSKSCMRYHAFQSANWSCIYESRWLPARRNTRPFTCINVENRFSSFNDVKDEFKSFSATFCAVFDRCNFLETVNQNSFSEALYMLSEATSFINYIVNLWGTFWK